MPLVPNDKTLAVAQQNLINLNVAFRSDLGTIVFGPPGDFYIAQSGSGLDTSFITLPANRVVVCAPGCQIKRKRGFLSKPNGVMTMRAGSSWTGATFVGVPDLVRIDGINYAIYPDGPVIRAAEDDAVLRDVGISGYAGIAMMVAGDRVRILNPSIDTPQE